MKQEITEAVPARPVLSGRSLLKWRQKNSYYYQWQDQLFAANVRPHSRVLHVGCECGDLLAAVQPSFGVGVDPDEASIEVARSRFEHLHFEVQDPHTLCVEGPFDYILINHSIGNWKDIQQIFENLLPLTHEDTRIIVTYYSYLWEWLLRLGSVLRMRRPNRCQNWLPPEDIKNFLSLTGCDVIRYDSSMMMPKRIPLLAAFCNRLLSPLPGFRHLNLINMVIARPLPAPKNPQDYSVSVIVPCRNERGNIAEAIERIPPMGRRTEIIFVDGGSTDGTAEEIERQIERHLERPIQLLHQGDGVGKGDAVRKGFAAATGDVLVIQDADLTAPPEDLPKFFRAWCQGKGEFINGSRLVYPMEKQAMRFLNLLGNKFFGMLFSWLLNQRFRDTLCGTKMLSRRHYDLLAANRAYFGEFDPFGDFDLIFGSVKQNFKVVEVPVTYRARTYGDTNISRFRHGWLLLKMSWVAFRKFKWH